MQYLIEIFGILLVKQKIVQTTNRNFIHRSTNIKFRSIQIKKVKKD